MDRATGKFPGTRVTPLLSLPESTEIIASEQILVKFVNTFTARKEIDLSAKNKERTPKGVRSLFQLPVLPGSSSRSRSAGCTRGNGGLRAQVRRVLRGTAHNL